MIIECPTCEAKVHARLIAEKACEAGFLTEAYNYYLLECPSCNNPILGRAGWLDFLECWGIATRVWPNPDKIWHESIPKLVQSSLDEAQKCFKAHAHSACSVMCGRALEAICLDKTGEKTLSNGIKKLIETKIIDDRLSQWAEALRIERNLGAHAKDHETPRSDAKDLLDFTIAIVEYVYVMAARFSSYEDRKLKRAARNEQKPNKSFKADGVPPQP